MFAKLKSSLGPGYLDAITRASTMGLHIVSGILVGSVIGYGMDYWLDTTPWCFFAGVLLGIAGGFKNVYTDAQLLVKAQESDSSLAGSGEPARENGPDAGARAPKDDGPARGQ